MSLVAYGPSGTNKSHILNQLVTRRLSLVQRLDKQSLGASYKTSGGGRRRRPLKHRGLIVIDCRLLLTSADLLWTLQTSLAKHLVECCGLKKPVLWKPGRSNYTTVDLANFLRTSIDETAQVTLYVLLDHLAHIVDHPALLQPLCDLARTSERDLRILATLQTAPTTTSAMLPANFVHFPAYSSAQWRSLLLRQLQQIYRPALSAHAPSSSSSISSKVVSDVEAAMQEALRHLLDQALDLLLYQQPQLLSAPSSSSITSSENGAMPLLTTVTRCFLLQALQSLWAVLQGEDLARSAQRLLQHFSSQERHRAQEQQDHKIADSSTLDANINDNNHTIRSHSNSASAASAALRKCPLATVRSLVARMSQLRRFTVLPPRDTPSAVHDEEADFYHSLRRLLPQSSAAASDGSMLSKPANNNSSSSFSTTGATASWTQRSVRDLPYHALVLVVACFLAAQRPRTQDADMVIASTTTGTCIHIYPCAIIAVSLRSLTAF